MGYYWPAAAREAVRHDSQRDLPNQAANVRMHAVNKSSTLSSCWGLKRRLAASLWGSSLFTMLCARLWCSST